MVEFHGHGQQAKTKTGSVIVGLLVVTISLCLLPSSTFAQVQLVAETEPLSPAEQQKKFRLPPGFVIELIACEPDIQKPMNLKFDAAGRLFVTQSLEYPFPVGLTEKGRDTIRVMVDTNGDGVPDKTSVYAEGLNIPIGVTPVPGGVLGYGIPELSFFPDADGDLKADSRQPLYGNWGFRDTHGMCSSLNYWIDGWVYGCHGFSNESTIQGADKQALQMQSGNTYRLKPDGSHIEAYTRGQVNPFGMCLDPWGNAYTSDCHSKPAYLLLPGAYYPSFGKPHDGLGFGPEIMQHSHGSTGIAGVVYYEADQFPAEYRGNLILGNPVTGRINRDTLAWTGSTPKAIEQPDFVTCDDPWFRPVDLQLAPDGSIYVADFYNRIIGHYEVPLTHPGRDRERGRIWRIRYVGTKEVPAQPTAAPKLTELSAKELVEALKHPNLWVRVQATHQLVEKAKANPKDRDALKEQLSSHLTPEPLAHLLWVFARQDEPLVSLTQARHESPLVRAHVMQIAGQVSAEAFAQFANVVQAGLTDPDPRVQRAAVQALARQPQKGMEGQLLKLWQSTNPADAMLVHATRITLRDHLAKFEGWDEARQGSPEVADVDHRLAEIALGVPAVHAAKFLEQFLIAQPPQWVQARLADWVHHTVRYLPEDSLLPRVSFLSQQSAWPQGQQLATLKSTHRGLQERGVKDLPPVTPWAERLTQTAWTQGAKQQALELTRDFRLSSQAPTVEKVVMDTNADPGLRKLALETLAVVSPQQAIIVGIAWLSPPLPPADLQQHAALILGGLNREEAATQLLQRLQASPEATSLAIARGLALTLQGGNALVQAIEQGRASPRLLQDAPIEQRLRALQVRDFDQRREKLLQGLPAVDERVLQFIAERRQGFSGHAGNNERGQALFKKHCMACHRLGNEGAKIGPELDGVGLRGLDRLLEDTLDPSRVVDQAFRTTVLNTTEGKVLTGLVLREEGATVVLADDQGREVRVPSEQIDERATVKLSPMPANLAEKMTTEEYFDLLSYLLSQQQKPPEPRKR